MNIKTKTALATLLLSFALVGCGGGGGDAPDSGTVVDSGTDLNAGDTTTGGTAGGEITPITLTGEAASALSYVNKVLADMGLPVMAGDEHLTFAADKHAEYLIVNDVYSHYEDSSLPAYYGYDLSERTTLAGWEAGGVGENVAGSSGYISGGEALSANLMTAIYHRFGFFSGCEAVGIGYKESADSSVIVFDMGSISYENPAPGRTYFLWPAEGVNYAGILFKGETPDPLTDIPENRSGNPISVSFNTFEVDCSSIDITSFSLSSATEGVEPVLKTMTAVTDPNDKFNACEFALFPRNILLSGETYTASFEYTENGTAKTISWSFLTKDMPVGTEVLYYPAGDSSFTVERGVTYTLFPESRDASKLLTLYTESYNPNGAIPTTSYLNGFPVIEFSGNAGTVELTQDDSGDVITFNVN